MAAFDESTRTCLTFRKMQYLPGIEDWIERSVDDFADLGTGAPGFPINFLVFVFRLNEAHVFVHVDDGHDFTWADELTGERLHEPGRKGQRRIVALGEIG